MLFGSRLFFLFQQLCWSLGMHAICLAWSALSSVEEVRQGRLGLAVVLAVTACVCVCVCVVRREAEGESERVSVKC